MCRARYRALREAQPRARPDWAWVDALTRDEVDYIEQLPFTLSIPSHNVIGSRRLGRAHAIHPAPHTARSPIPTLIPRPCSRPAVVHAGLVPGVPLPQQHPLLMTNMRNLAPVPYWAQVLGAALRRLYALLSGRPQPRVPHWFATKAGADHSQLLPWAALWPSGGPRVIFGHDAKRRLQVRAAVGAPCPRCVEWRLRLMRSSPVCSRCTPTPRASTRAASTATA